MEILKGSGLRPNRDIAFQVVAACFDNNRPDLAVAYCKEFEANGLAARPAMRQRVDQYLAREETQPPAPLQVLCLIWKQTTYGYSVIGQQWVLQSNAALSKERLCAGRAV